MPGPLIQRKDIGTAAVSSQKRRFGRPTGKMREARVHFAFTAADTEYSMPHGLGVMPSSFKVVLSGNAAGDAFPGVYAADPVYWATKNVIVLKSDTATSWAEVVVTE